jgi:hypothetical protein
LLTIHFFDLTKRRTGVNVYKSHRLKARWGDILCILLMLPYDLLFREFPLPSLSNKSHAIILIDCYYFLI